MQTLIKIFSFFLIVAVVIVAMLFSVENGDLARVDFLVLSLELPISLWLLGTLLLGFVVGLLASSGLFFRLIVQRRKARRIEATQQKLAKL